MGIDGFRIDTMKHVNDEFWQKVRPSRSSRTPKSQGKRELTSCFGEVFDLSRPFTSTFTTRNKMQAVLDFPFQDAARRLRLEGTAREPVEHVSSATTTEVTPTPNSNVYQLPTFLGAITIWAGSATS